VTQLAAVSFACAILLSSRQVIADDDVKLATITVSNRMMMAGDDPFGSPKQAFSMGTIEITESVQVVFGLDAE
jgi:hypothetical protein